MDPAELRSALTELPDADLIRRIAEDRDAEAFNIVYEREGTSLLRFASLLARRHGEAPNAEDVAIEAVHRTFLRLWERAATFDPTRAVAAGVPADRALGSWLRAILRHEVFRIAKKQRVAAQHEPQLEALTGEVDVADRVEAEWRQLREGKIEDALASVQQALAGISPPSRTLLTAVYIDEVPREEVANRLGISLSVLRVRLHRAITELRKAVQSEERR